MIFLENLLLFIFQGVSEKKSFKWKTLSHRIFFGNFNPTFFACIFFSMAYSLTFVSPLLADDRCTSVKRILEEGNNKKIESKLNKNKIARCCGFYLVDHYYRSNQPEEAQKWFTIIEYDYNPNDSSYELYLFYSILFGEKSKDKNNLRKRQLLNPALASELNTGKKQDKDSQLSSAAAGDFLVSDGSIQKEIEVPFGEKVADTVALESQHYETNDSMHKNSLWMNPTNDPQRLRYIQSFHRLAETISKRTNPDELIEPVLKNCALDLKPSYDTGAMPTFMKQFCKDSDSKDFRNRIFISESYNWLLYYFAKYLALDYGDFRSAYEIIREIDATEKYEDFDEATRKILKLITKVGHMIEEIYLNAPAAQKLKDNIIPYTLTSAQLLKPDGGTSDIIVVAGNGYEFLVYDLNASKKSKRIVLFVTNEVV